MNGLENADAVENVVTGDAVKTHATENDGDSATNKREKNDLRHNAFNRGFKNPQI